jgi:hypothetical protein
MYVFNFRRLFRLLLLTIAASLLDLKFSSSRHKYVRVFSYWDRNQEVCHLVLFHDYIWFVNNYVAVNVRLDLSWASCEPEEFRSYLHLRKTDGRLSFVTLITGIKWWARRLRGKGEDTEHCDFMMRKFQCHMEDCLYHTPIADNYDVGYRIL